jgi:recombination protein RecA
MAEKKEDVMTRINKKLEKALSPGSGLQNLRDAVTNESYMSTGLVTLDSILNGGWSFRRINVVWGPWRTGKTPLALMALREAQKLNAIILFVDAEMAVAGYMLNLLGVDHTAEGFYLQQPDNLEETFKMIMTFLREMRAEHPDRPIVVVWDSVGVQATESMEQSVEDNKENFRMATETSVLSKYIKLLIPIVYKTNTCALFLNQARDVMNSPVHKLKQAGGNVLHHAGSNVIQMKPPEIVKAPDGSTMTILKPFTERIKVGSPYKSTKIRVSDAGVDDYPAILEALVASGAIEKGGAWYNCPKLSKKWNGEYNFYEWVGEDPKNYEAVKELYLKI